MTSLSATGAQLVRLTVQGNREAEACMKIKEVLAFFVQATV